MTIEPEVVASSEEDILFSRIALFDNPRKSDYLGYRACSFSIREACRLTPISEAQVRKWRAEDPEFARFESNIPELQKTIGADLLRGDFARNVKLFLKVDFQVLAKAAIMGLDVATMSAGEAVLAGLSTREFEYLKTIRKEYAPAAMLAFHKALEPEATAEDRGMLQQVIVYVDGKLLSDEAARAAAGKSLLDQWKENKKMLPESKDDNEES